MSRIRVVKQEKNRQKVSKIYVKKKRRKRDKAKVEVPVDGFKYSAFNEKWIDAKSNYK